MDSFIQRHAADTIGVLSGFDRLRFRGTLRLLATVGGMLHTMSQLGVLLKDFGGWVEHSSNELKAATQRIAHQAGRPVLYLPSSARNKEEAARAIATRDRVQEGLVAVLTCVETCRSYQVHRNRATKQLDLQIGPRKCLHHYFYFLDRQLGWMHARLQTWFPFTLQICVNGREWLARQMDRTT